MWRLLLNIAALAIAIGGTIALFMRYRKKGKKSILSGLGTKKTEETKEEPKAKEKSEPKEPIF